MAAALAACGNELMRALADAGMAIVATLFVIRHVVGCPGLFANVRSFHSFGGTLLYGSDYGVPDVPAGVVVEELELLAEAGLKPTDVLRAATGRAGEMSLCAAIRCGGSRRFRIPCCSSCADGSSSAA